MQLMLPSDFENRMKKMLGREWEDFLSCYQKDRYQALRLNTLKIADDKTTLSLLNDAGMGEKQDFAPVPWAEAGYYYSDEFRPGRHPYHEMGLYYIQEPSAMSAAAVLAPDPGMRVLDLCAAPGGKTTQLASYMQQEGLLVANEISSQRARILAQNVERMGIRNCLVVNEDSSTLRMHFPAFFHKILVDAPCSGEGMFRKNPAAMNEWSLANVDLCADRQAEILDNAAAMLLPGGEIVYSTCTFAPKENEQAIESFLSRNPDFEIRQIDRPCFSPGNPEWAAQPDTSEFLKSTARLWPHHLHGEGHYVAHLVKKGILPVSCAMPVSRKNEQTSPGGKGRKGKSKGKTGAPDPEQLKVFREFLLSTLTEKCSLTIEEDNLLLFGDHLYLLPAGAPSLTGLHVLRAGLELGVFKKNRFEPSHALALTLSKSDCRVSVSLLASDRRADAFYRGESLTLSQEDFPAGMTAAKGWCLFCLDGYSAGWGKLTDQTMKNHYPKGLRYDYSID